MHYLKCKNCGYLNEVKSEYLIFCSSCNKKLDDNYSDWKKINQDKTLDDFKKLICISEEEINKNVERPKHKRKSIKYWIGFAVTFAIFYAVGQFGGQSIIKFFKSEKTEKEVIEKKWIKETYGSFGLTVETPVKMVKGELTIPDNIKQIIDQMDVYNYMSSKGFKVMINSVKYNPVIGKANLQGAANGSINEIKMLKGVTNFDYSEDYLYKNDIPGFIQHGTYKQDGIGIEFINTGFSKGLIFWQVLVAYQTNDDVGRIAAERVIESIEINYNKEL